ncbi:MAG: peptidase domain protein [Frankiales bacterium]|nr:peptidase domain protein [Frankiales bacterium]
MTTTSPDARPVPPLGKPRTAKLPTVGERTLDNGLRVLAVRRPGVALTELRLRVPFAAPSRRGAARNGEQHVARAQLLGDTLLSGTAVRNAGQIAADVQALGGQLSASTDADRLGMGGSVLSSGLPGLLELLAEVLTSASYPKAEVVGERDRLVQELAIYRTQPSVAAREALVQRLYGEHPYGRELPGAEAVQEVTPAHLRKLHAERVAPAGSVLVVVGDQTPARMLSLVEAALSGWTATAAAVETPPVPAVQPQPALLVDRPGSVQTTLRFGGPAPRRTDPGYAAFSLANLVFGGYFSSRWVANIREDKGYTYSPHSGVEHPPAGSRVVVAADVATEVTAPSVLETWYELGRIATVPVEQGELDQARRYAVGSLALSTSSQAGLASTLAVLTAAGLGVEHLRDHPKNLAAVTVEDVLEAAATWLAPHRLTGVLVGDADAVEASVGAVLDVERG